MVFFCGGSVVLRRCWELVDQCRKDCYSTMPTLDNFLALLNIFLFSGGNVVLRRCWWLVHQCRKNAIQQYQFFMILGHCLIFYFPASRLYLALVVVGTTVPKQRLFISANFWWLLAQLKVFFWGQCCTSALLRVSLTAPKRMLFNSDNFWWFPALFNNLLFFRDGIVFQHCWGVQYWQQNLFNSANFWCFSALLSFLSFSGGNVVLRRFWWLVLQCRYNGCSLVPIFDDYWHSWRLFYFVAARVYFGAVDG